jgi:16S rRNA (cytosine967-C5)-methyltransferase
MLPYLKESMSEDDLKQFAAISCEEAQIDIRVNTLKALRDDVQRGLIAQGVEIEPTPFSPVGLRLKQRQSLEGHDFFQSGQIAVQDEGSQLLALLCAAEPSMSVLDYCAGAGGKTLALAAQMKNKGQLVAADLHDWRLAKAKVRLKAAGVHNVRFQNVTDTKFFKRHRGTFDRVLVDAPCSGTGTWRRNPDLKLRMSIDYMNRLQETQREILSKAAPLVGFGGYLIYATCSILTCENQKQIEWFLEQHADFSVVETLRSKTMDPLFQELKEKSLSTLGITLAPHVTGTDGFYICIMERNP